jgi:Protein of unknown function (DUF4089)
MDNNEHVTAWCDAMAELLDLPLDKADRKEIIANLRVLKQQMNLIGNFTLDDREEPAPQFRA